MLAPRPEPLGVQLSTLEALEEVVELLASAPAYRRGMLEGLVASLGGLDHQLAAKASQVGAPGDESQFLSVHWKHPSFARAGDILPGPSSPSQSLAVLIARHGDSLSRALIEEVMDIWGKHARSPRLATPLLRTADTLLGKGGFQSVSSDGALLERLLELVRGEIRQCKDIPRQGLGLTPPSALGCPLH